MKPINIILEFVPSKDPRHIVTLMCSFLVSEDTTAEAVRQTFANAFIPSVAAAKIQGADTDVAIFRALKTTEEKLNCECLILQADACARFII